MPKSRFGEKSIRTTDHADEVRLEWYFMIFILHASLYRGRNSVPISTIHNHAKVYYSLLRTQHINLPDCYWDFLNGYCDQVANAIDLFISYKFGFRKSGVNTTLFIDKENVNFLKSLISSSAIRQDIMSIDEWNKACMVAELVCDLTTSKPVTLSVETTDGKKVTISMSDTTNKELTSFITNLTNT